jgi:putative ABC transport system substrate-binding protein
MNSRRRILTSGAQVEPIIAPVHSDAEIETVITSLAREPGGGLITVPDNFVNSHRQTVISLAARNKIPAVYQISVFVRDGGLLSYGADDVDAYRRAATVVERILRGEKPSDLPVQLPAKFEMAVNLKTAKPSASPRKRGLYRRQLGDEETGMSSGSLRSTIE